MSKQSEAKERQGYIQKPVPRTCANCKHYSSDMSSYLGWDKQEYFREENIRCSIGGFAIKKMATCNEFELADAALKAREIK